MPNAKVGPGEVRLRLVSLLPYLPVIEIQSTKERSSLLSIQYLGIRAKMGWQGIRIMCLSWATCLTTDSCLSELVSVLLLSFCKLSFVSIYD